MSDHHPCRSLLLERLESRSLLAAGLLAFSGGQHGPDNDHQRRMYPGDRSGGDRFGNDRPADVRVLQHSTTRNDLNQDLLRRDRPTQLRSERNQPPVGLGNPSLAYRPTVPRPPLISVGLTPGSASNSSTPTSASINDVPGLIVSGSGSRTSIPTLPSDGVDWVIRINIVSSVDTPRVNANRIATRPASVMGDVATNPSSQSLVVASESAEVRADAIVERARDVVNVRDGQPAAFAANVENTDQVSANDSDDLRQQASSVPWSGDHESQFSSMAFRQDPTVGRVFTDEWFSDFVLPTSESSEPLLPTDSVAVTDSEAEPWTLDRDSIGRLRALTLPSLATDGGSVDQAMTDWFGGPGGLIELQSNGELFLIPDSASEIVEIPLDVIVASHRWLEIAALDQPADEGNEIRDAILAAIRGEQTAHAVPLREASATRGDAFVYSGAALAASTLAIASRRKQKQLWSKTGGGEPGSKSRDSRH